MPKPRQPGTLQLQSYSTKGLDPYKLLQDLRNIVDAVNKNSAGVQQTTMTLQRVVQAAQQAAAAQGGGGGGLPPSPVGPFPALYVDPNGAILGDGTSLNPLRVSVDGVTISIVGDQLTVLGSSGPPSQQYIPMVDGATPPNIMSVGPDLLLVLIDV